MASADYAKWGAIVAMLAATLPLVASIFAAFHPSTRVRSTSDYFIFSGGVDIDTFLKASIGYSLQAAAIYLFFSWSISYGLWAALVAIAWMGGYYLLARALEAGFFDGFLQETKERPITIHGFVGAQLRRSSWLLTRITILIVSLATVIGLGGTMITEIDYAGGIILRAAGLLGPDGKAVDQFSYQSSIVHLTVLLFVLLYVLWGGYKAVMVTERVQVPAAYVAFVLFGLGVILQLVLPQASNIGRILLAMIVVLLVAILSARWTLLRRLGSRPEEGASVARTSALLTFLPLILVAGATLVYSFTVGRTASPPSFVVIAFPDLQAAAGFGLIGIIALIVTNVVWQFVDISSLQRLQSIARETDSETGRALVAKALRTTGLEAGLGWLVIIVVGLSLRQAGITDPLQVADLGPFLVKHGLSGVILVGIFSFSASVFVLSTISGFISALAYVSYYDVIGGAGLQQPNGREALDRARLVTFLSVLFLYAAYLVLKRFLDADQDLISAALYAIYAFQIAILPAVIGAMIVAYSRRKGKSMSMASGLSPNAVFLSTAAGIATALYVSTSRSIFESWMPIDSTYVLPPLAAVSVSAVTFIMVTLLRVALRRMR